MWYGQFEPPRGNAPGGSQRPFTIANSIFGRIVEKVVTFRVCSIVLNTASQTTLWDTSRAALFMGAVLGLLTFYKTENT